MINNANLLEIFSTIQGEGLFVGTKQIFLRFAGCNLNCRYCDTVYRPQDFCQISSKQGDFNIKNPVNISNLVGIVNSFPMKEYHSVSLTGGEPLLNCEFLTQLLPLIDKPQHGILLETNGTLPGALEKVLDLIDIISMDIKIFSMTEENTQWEQHRRFLKIAKTKRLYVKVVVGEQTDFNELNEVFDLISSVDPAVPLILQPVTDKANPNWFKDNASQILDFQTEGLKYLKDVRIIPQIHKFLGLL